MARGGPSAFSLQRSIVPPLRQSRKAGWGWAGERLAASGEPQVGVWGGPEKRGVGLAKSEPGRRGVPSHRGPDSGPLLQRAGLTVKVPAPGSSRGRAGPAPLLSESESREENLSEFLRKLALSSQGWFSRHPSMFCSKASHCFRCAPFGKDTATCLSLTPIAGNAEPVRTALASGGGDGQGQLLRHLCLFQGPPVLEAESL